MAENKYNISEGFLFSYVVASADMRYIEVSEREIFLRNDPDVGPVLQGELPGCEGDCFADLSQIFLEYALSCEGCREPDTVTGSVTEFGERLGSLLAPRLYQAEYHQSPVEQLSSLFACVLNSMHVSFREVRSADQLRFDLEHCPLCETGSKSGLSREMAFARLGFAAFCERVVTALTSEWLMHKPTVKEPGDTLLEIVIVRASNK